MGKVEKSVRNRKIRQDIAGTLLSAVAVAGVLTWTAVAPNTLRLLKYLPRDKRGFDTSASRARKKLIDDGYLEVIFEDGRRLIRLTKKGERRLDVADQFDAVTRKQKWDGNWRIVAFDVPERRKKARDHIRFLLRKIGFRQLQASLWVYPYACEELVSLLKADAALGQEVVYIVSRDIEGEDRLLKLFGLSRR